MKSTKKSEMLEVRLSHEDKQALQAKAADEGSTVSFVIRRLISGYLTQPDARSHPNRLTELLMTLKSKPKSILAVAAACVPILALPVFIATPANAEDISITLAGEYISPVFEDGVEGKRVQRFTTELELGFDQFIAMRLPSLQYQGSETSLFMVAKITEVEKVVNIRIQICETPEPPTHPLNEPELVDVDACTGGRMIAEPTISAAYGEKAEFKMGDGDGETFRLSAQPKRL